MWPVKPSPKWPIMCRVGHYTLLYRESSKGIWIGQLSRRCGLLSFWSGEKAQFPTSVRIGHEHVSIGALLSSDPRVRNSWGTVTSRNRKTTLHMAASTTSAKFMTKTASICDRLAYVSVQFRSVRSQSDNLVTPLGLDIREIRRKISCTRG